MTPEQCVGARRLLNWTMRQLADEAAVSLTTVNKFETRRPGYSVRVATLHALQRTLERAGVEFVAAASLSDKPSPLVGLTFMDGSAVRLRTPERK